MIIEPTPADHGGVAAKLLAAADDPRDVRTVDGQHGVAFEVPDEVAAKAGFLDAPASTRPKRAPRKTATKKPDDRAADTNT